MWCPSSTLSMWANAWLAGAASPDDVLDALSHWAPRHSVTAYDWVAAGYTGLPWPDLNHSGAVSLLQTLDRGRPVALRPALRHRAAGARRDVRGLPAGTQFQRDALTAGEAIIVTDSRDPSAAVGLVPDFEYDGTDEDSEFDAEVRALSWTVYSALGTPMPEHLDLGEASMRCGPRCVRQRMRSAPGPAAWTSPTRGDLSSRCWSRPAGTGHPTMPRRGRCGCWITPLTSTRSSPSAPG